MKEPSIFDVLHCYFGSPFIVKYDTGETLYGKVEQINEDYCFSCGYGVWEPKSIWHKPEWEEQDGWYEMDDLKTMDFKLILRHPLDMTIEQRFDYKQLCKVIRDKEGKYLKVVDTPISLHFLFKNHIDAFDLIERGLAINAKELPEIIKVSTEAAKSRIEALEKEVRELKEKLPVIEFMNRFYPVDKIVEKEQVASPVVLEHKEIEPEKSKQKVKKESSRPRIGIDIRRQ